MKEDFLRGSKESSEFPCGLVGSYGLPESNIDQSESTVHHLQTSFPVSHPHRDSHIYNNEGTTYVLKRVVNPTQDRQWSNLSRRSYYLTSTGSGTHRPETDVPK